ncbi:LysM peptidoglycan-binding domain-containing protein [Marilutibacter alkalisoli]|uniref:LysM domain-containing protein n=1 Tax=Marilutibacter alkalisoli TaxID=2591633 RepID=A0A514BS01_9GAMM|nr:hypothetical protein [Lysobacter alkalisoli]QDH70166.1 hypothetical protein FKV23_08695 [Lysobacter alkalisoli]
MYRSAYDLRGQKVLEFHREQLGGSGRGVSKAYTYDVAGRLVETRGYFASDATRQVSYREGAEEIYWDLQIGGWLSGAEQFSFDGDGRVVKQTTRGRPDGDWWQAFGTPLEGPSGNQRTDLGVLQLRSEVLYTKADGSSGYDTLGRLQSYRYRGHDIGWATHTYTSTWQGWGSYQERTVTGSSSNPDYKTTTNTLTYDGMGRLLSQLEKTNYDNVDDRMRYYAYTGDGQVQRRREGRIEDGVFRQDDPNQPNNPKPNYLFVHAGGQQHAELKEGGQIRTRYGSRGDQTQLQGLGGSGRYEAGGGKVTVLAGETLRGLAQRVYGTPQLWYVLADANGLGDPDTPLTAGTQLNAPSTRVSSNDANTFKPYNPSEAIGNTAPGLPYITPPPKNSCNAVAMILIVVVAVAVTVFTAGAAAGAMYGVAASALSVGQAAVVGAIAGAAGAAASSAVGSAMGVTSFSWRGVAAGGITGAITGGLVAQFGTVGGALSGAPQWGKAAALAVANAGANYAGQKLAGMDVSFSWNSIAASAVSSLGAAKIAPMIAGKLDLKTDFANRFTYGTTGGMVSLALRSSSGQTLHTSDYATVFADAFGNALGRELGHGTEQWLASRAGAGTAAMGGVNEGYSNTVSVSFDAPRSNAIGPMNMPISGSNTDIGLHVPGTYDDAGIRNEVRVTAVADGYSPDGWYFYGWNQSRQQWVDVQRRRIDAVQWSSPPARYTASTSVQNFTAQLQADARRTGPQHWQLPIGERLGVRYSDAEYKADLESIARTGKPMPRMMAYDSAAAARREIEWQQTVAKVDAYRASALSGALVDAGAPPELAMAAGDLATLGRGGSALRPASVRVRPRQPLEGGIVPNSVERVSSRPQWLQRLDAGNAFNAERAVAYPYNEVYINKPGGAGYYRLDSYSPAAGEIVSRKFTQFADIQPQTALGYINEIPAKYPVGGVIANVPSSGQLSGQILRGQYILEVPVQVRPIPPSVLDGANRAGVLIRDVNGRIY